MVGMLMDPAVTLSQVWMSINSGQSSQIRKNNDFVNELFGDKFKTGSPDALEFKIYTLFLFCAAV